MPEFATDQTFLVTSHFLGDLSLCQARLQGDARWPWIILIPLRADVCEIEDLSLGDRARLIEESVVAGKAVRALGEALGRPVEKLNHGALGNTTPQLHLHVVGRRADDAAWPAPVWGFGTKVAYAYNDLGTVIGTARRGLGL